VRRLVLAAVLVASLFAVSAGTAAASVPKPPVVHDALGWNQNLTRPSFLGALHSLVPPKAIDGSFVLENLRWSSWGQNSARGTGRIGWAQPGPGGNGISRQAAVTVTLSAVAAHQGTRYFSRLAFSFTWRGHKYGGRERFADPCGNTTGCWVIPGTPIVARTAGGAAPVPATTRPVVVYEPALTGPHPVRDVVRPSSWYLTIGPATEFRGAHWSSWGAKTAAGTATMYVIDFGTHNEGHAKLELYDVRNHDDTRYFSRLHVTGAKTENGVWNWCFNIGEWQASCPG
jgi:hypothetical protein